MKLLLLLISIIFCSYESANADPRLDKEYWIEEINKTGGFTNLMLSKTLPINGLEELYANGKIPGGSRIDKKMWRQYVVAIAEAIKSNPEALKYVNLSYYLDPECNQFYLDTLLHASIYNKTSKRIQVTSSIAFDANIITKIIEINKTVQDISLNISGLSDDAAYAIAKSLRNNNTLLALSFENTSFSMKARKAIKAAWQVRNVQGRNQQIQF